MHRGQYRLPIHQRNANSSTLIFEKVPRSRLLALQLLRAHAMLLSLTKRIIYLEVCLRMYIHQRLYSVFL